jgi:hypothetical protein
MIFFDLSLLLCKKGISSIITLLLAMELCVLGNADGDGP